MIRLSCAFSCAARSALVPADVSPGRAQNILTAPWRAERLNFELRDARAELDVSNEQLDSLVHFINREVASAAKKEAELKKVKATTAVKAVAATMVLTLHKCVPSSSTCLVCLCAERLDKHCRCLGVGGRVTDPGH